jgi:hypothetical protein
MTQTPTSSSQDAQTASDLSIVLWVIQSTVCITANLCEVLRFAHDDRLT